MIKRAKPEVVTVTKGVSKNGGEIRGPSGHLGVKKATGFELNRRGWQSVMMPVARSYVALALQKVCKCNDFLRVRVPFDPPEHCL